MKERPELLTADEYNEICMEMLEFQEKNNRLTYSDSESEQGEASVEDKSFLSLKRTRCPKKSPSRSKCRPRLSRRVSSKVSSTFLADESGERAGFLEQLL